MADQHNAGFMGCAGHNQVKTPNLDALAARGTLFSAAYTPSPICVSARAAFATGKYVHRIGAWDNVHPYSGTPPSWAHLSRDAGHPTVSVGKLHYRSEEDDTGFRQIVPLHVVDGVGDVKSLLRSPPPPGKKRSKLVERIGPGETGYTRYDRQIADEAVAWLTHEAAGTSENWVLFVSFYCPHHPYSAPQAYYDLYDPADVELPKTHATRHPWVEALTRTRNDDEFFDDDTRRRAIANYLGLCSFVDDNVGKLLAALDSAGLKETTRVIYTSDHGEALGARRIWQKYNLYEEAARIPFIAAGPGVPAGVINPTPVSLIDVYPTVGEALGLEAAEDRAVPEARSVWALARQNEPARRVFSEYHGSASPSAAFMLRRWPYKLIHYVGFAPELFDLSTDPEERIDLAAQPAYRATVAALEAELRRICDPEATDRRAKADQEAKIEVLGGRAVIEARGWLQGTPPPGEKAEPMD
jgi:choline-sulfatase